MFSPMWINKKKTYNTWNVGIKIAHWTKNKLWLLKIKPIWDDAYIGPFYLREIMSRLWLRVGQLNRMWGNEEATLEKLRTLSCTEYSTGEKRYTSSPWPSTFSCTSAHPHNLKQSKSFLSGGSKTFKSKTKGISLWCQ